MANGHGGKRTPGSPAPVSGPGALSQRTDGGPQQVQAEMTGMDYGANKDFQEIQSSAPLAAAQSQRFAAGRQPVSQPASVTPLFAPTQRPDEPVTAGAPFGPGPGAAQTPAATRSLADTLARILPYDDSGDVARFYNIAVSRGW